MTIKVGDSIPLLELTRMTTQGPESISTNDIFMGKKVVALGLPGAFTPTCSAKHLPGFIRNGEAIKSKGVDTIVCISVNDAFVMGAWGESQGVGNIVLMVAYGSGFFASATGLELDLSNRGFGMRSQRFAMIVQDGIVSSIHIDAGGTFGETSAETILGLL